MTAEEFTRKKGLLQGYEGLLKNPAYQEMLALFQRHQGNALAGLRNRNTPREKRDEYLQAGEDAEELLGFVDGRIKALTDELRAPPDDFEDAGRDEG
jgi:hypothetical protein